MFKQLYPYYKQCASGRSKLDDVNLRYVVQFYENLCFIIPWNLFWEPQMHK